MESERNVVMLANAAVRSARPSAAESKRRFWLGVIGAFGFAGVAGGLFALVISLLTVCGVLHESHALGIVVSALLVGCLAALLTAAHGMDRLAAARRDEESESIAEKTARSI